MDEKLYELLEDIADSYYCEMVASDLRDDVLEILTQDLEKDLLAILGKIKYYGKLK